MGNVHGVNRATGATALPRLTAPTAEELGMAESVYLDELGDSEIVVFEAAIYITLNNLHFPFRILVLSCHELVQKSNTNTLFI